jgi:ribosomal protein S18 acetylase RimI-like enzyme
MVVRAARVEDAPALARVIVDTCRSAHRSHVPEAYWQKRFGEWTYEDSERNWRRSLRQIASGKSPRECTYVAVDSPAEGMGDREVVGLAVGGPPKAGGPADTGEIYALYVCESHQRRGLGRRLVQAVAAHLATVGMPALRIGCLAVNTPARCFYEALGGRVVGEREILEYGFTLREVIYGWPDTRDLAVVGSMRV